MGVKVVVCSSNNKKNALVSDRFARTDYFCLYSNDEYEFVSNDAKEEMSGAGGKAVKQISSLDVDVILVPEVGPKAFDALVAFDITAYKYPKNISVEQAVTMFLNNELEEVKSPSRSGKH